MGTLPTQEKYLDCIAMKRAIQKEISAETKGMTPKERLAHYKKLETESPFSKTVRQRSLRDKSRE